MEKRGQKCSTSHSGCLQQHYGADVTDRKSLLKHDKPRMKYLVPLSFLLSVGNCKVFIFNLGLSNIPHEF